MNDRDVEELQRIWELKEKGAISEDEYSTLKRRIIGSEDQKLKKEDVKPKDSSFPNQPTSGKSSARFHRQLAIVSASIVGLIFIAALIGSNTVQSGNSLVNESAASSLANATAADTNAADTNAGEASVPDVSPWSYSEDEDKVRG